MKLSAFIKGHENGEGLCYICGKHITNFICIERFASRIMGWLPRKYIRKFNSFHEQLLNDFPTCNKLETGQCRNNGNAICKHRETGNLCIYCYVMEVTEWFLGTGNRPLFEDFVETFSIYWWHADGSKL